MQIVAGISVFFICTSVISFCLKTLPAMRVEIPPTTTVSNHTATNISDFYQTSTTETNFMLTTTPRPSGLFNRYSVNNFFDVHSNLLSFSYPSHALRFNTFESQKNFKSGNNFNVDLFFHLFSNKILQTIYFFPIWNDKESLKCILNNLIVARQNKGEEKLRKKSEYQKAHAYNFHFCLSLTPPNNFRVHYGNGTDNDDDEVEQNST